MPTSEADLPSFVSAPGSSGVETTKSGPDEEELARERKQRWAPSDFAARALWYAVNG